MNNHILIVGSDFWNLRNFVLQQQSCHENRTTDEIVEHQRYRQLVFVEENAQDANRKSQGNYKGRNVENFSCEPFLCRSLIYNHLIEFLESFIGFISLLYFLISKEVLHFV